MKKRFSWFLFISVFIAVGVFVCNDNRNIGCKEHGADESGVQPKTPTASISNDISRVLPPSRAIASVAVGVKPVMAATVTASELSRMIDVIVEAEESPKHHLERERLLKSLGRSLPEPEIMRLVAYLRLHDDPTLTRPEFAAIRNELLNLLRHQLTPVPRLAENLSVMYHDENHDPVWRDYCVQHIGVMDGDESKDVRNQVLRSALSSGRNVGAGTALIALSRVTNPPEDLDAGDIALVFVSDTATPDSVKATALQVAMEHRLDDALGHARLILANDASDTLLKISAIAVLCRASDPADDKILDALEMSHDSRISKAVKIGRKHSPN